jgi:CspA family cold shock protein
VQPQNSNNRVERFIGKVVWFDSVKGFGFIKANDEKVNNGKEIFFHFRWIIMRGFKVLRKDDTVEFSIGSNAKGICAMEVKFISPGSYHE